MVIRLQRDILLLLFFINDVGCYVRCRSPGSYPQMTWLSITCTRTAIGLLQGLCPKLRSRSSLEWRKGDHVMSHCSRIPVWTAIATFLREGDLYRGHAAIFESCANDGIWVYDQTPSSRMERRKIKRIQLSTPQYNADNFYTIKI